MPDPERRLPPSDENNPYRNPAIFPATSGATYSPAGMSSPGQPPTTATSAVFSLVLALVSPLFLLCLGLSVIPSLAAIILGHVALVSIKRSGGALTGRGFAIAGLVCGYGVFLLSIAFIATLAPAIKEGIDRAKDEIAAAERGDAGPWKQAEQRFHSAESRIMGGSQGAAHGNSPEAIRLAALFAENMKTLREGFFTKKNKDSFSLTNGQFVTYCELHDDRCAFVVHVPSYRKFTAEAKQQLAGLAWAAASSAVSDQLDQEAQLAVGLKGTILYGAVMIGEVGGEQPPLDGDRDELIPFFEDDASNAEQPAAERDSPFEDPAPDTPPDMPAETDENAGAETKSDVVPDPTDAERGESP